MSATTEQARLVVAAAGILDVDGAERNGILLEGSADMIAIGSRHWGEEVAVIPVLVVAAYERALIDMGLNPQSIANKALKEAKE